MYRHYLNILVFLYETNGKTTYIFDRKNAFVNLELLLNLFELSRIIATTIKLAGSIFRLAHYL